MTRIAFAALALLATASALPAAAQDHPLDGVWEGAYECQQGKTGLTLTLDATPGGQVTGTFAFWPRAENPSVPRGSFRVAGTVTPDGQLRLNGVTWIVQPADYAMVNLSGVVRRGGAGSADAMLGDVSGAPSCTRWAARRK